MLRLVGISIKEYGPIKNLIYDFSNDINCVIGLNGSGKTWLLELIAAICGTQKCENIMIGRSCKLVHLLVKYNDKMFLFEHSGIFNSTTFCNFKRNFPHRLSVVKGERGNFPYTHGKTEIARNRTLMDFMYLNPVHEIEDDVIYDHSGHGQKNYVRLINSFKSNLFPYIIDSIESGLSIISQRDIFTGLHGYQIIVSTHSPDVISPFSNNNIIDLSKNY